MEKVIELNNKEISNVVGGASRCYCSAWCLGLHAVVTVVVLLVIGTLAVGLYNALETIKKLKEKEESTSEEEK